MANDNKLHAGQLLSRWVSGGRPTEAGRLALVRMMAALGAATGAHLDNTGGRCRVDLDEHDCCATCNLAGDALRLFAEHEAE